MATNHTNLMILSGFVIYNLVPRPNLSMHLLFFAVPVPVPVPVSLHHVFALPRAVVFFFFLAFYSSLYNRIDRVNRP